MSEFVIKIQAPELAKAITALAEALGSSRELTVEQPKKEVKKEESKKEVKKEEPKKVEAKEVPKKEESKKEVRAKFVELNKKGKKAELKKMLDNFKVVKVSDLKPEQYEEVMLQLGEM